MGSKTVPEIHRPSLSLPQWSDTVPVPQFPPCPSVPSVSLAVPVPPNPSRPSLDCRRPQDSVPTLTSLPPLQPLESLEATSGLPQTFPRVVVCAIAVAIAHTTLGVNCRHQLAWKMASEDYLSLSLKNVALSASYWK